MGGNDAGDAQADIIQTELAIKKSRNSKNTVLITEDGARNASHSESNRPAGGTFIVDDVVGGVTNSLLDAVLLSRPVGTDTADRAVLVKGHTGDVGHRPDGKLGIAMLTEDVGVDVVDINAAVIAEEVSEAGAIEDGAGADDAFFAVFPRVLDGGIGHDIDGIGGDQDDGRGSGCCDVRHNSAHDGGVTLKEVETSFAGLLGGARGDDDQLGVSIIGRRARIDRDRGEVGLAVGEVQDVPLGELFVLVDQGDLIGDAALGKSITISGADRASANDNNFAANGGKGWVHFVSNF